MQKNESGAEPSRVITQPPLWQLWKNPIFRRYCTSRLRPKGLSIGILLVLIVTGFSTGMFRAVFSSRVEMELEDVAKTMMAPLLFIQSIILFIMGTAQTSGGMISEADQGVIDYQRLMPISPMMKVLGYLFGLPVREYVLFAVTLPFTAWSLWVGSVPFHAWASVYTVLLVATGLYHLTGLFTGTVMRNRRWAFLISILLVFALYTVIPWLAKFGLVCFKYFSIMPVVEENLGYFSPRSIRGTVKLVQSVTVEAKFFNLNLPQLAFTVFSQAGLILGFLLMLQRRWHRTEALLLGKISATLLCIWVHILMLGNALPIIESGSIFPSRELNRRFLSRWEPNGWEAVGLSVIYGIMSMALVIILTNLCTPSLDQQTRGWRRAKKNGQLSPPRLADASSSFWAMLIMAMAGAGAWYLFTKGIVESHWFPGHFMQGKHLGYMAAILCSACVCFQTVMEKDGRGRAMFYLLMIGIVPLMVAAIMAVSTKSFPHLAIWVGGASPLSAVPLGMFSQLSLAEMDVKTHRVVENAGLFWLGVYLLAAIRLTYALHVRKNALARTEL